MATKPPRLYVPLDVNLPDDPRVMQVSGQAEHLYIRCLLEAKTHNSFAGFLTKAELNYAARRSGTQVNKRVKELEKVGLLIPANRDGQDGWQIRSWESWNLTQEQADKRRQDKVRAGFLRAHRAGEHRERRPEGCPKCEHGAQQGAEQSASKVLSSKLSKVAAKEKEKTKSSTSIGATPRSAGAGGRTPDRLSPPDEVLESDYHGRDVYALRHNWPMQQDDPTQPTYNSINDEWWNPATRQWQVEATVDLDEKDFPASEQQGAA